MFKLARNVDVGNGVLKRGTKVVLVNQCGEQLVVQTTDRHRFSFVCDLTDLWPAAR